ncbi:hypothetical protein ABPG73_007831 [Tetrahymena malaccensis]
MAYQSDQFRSIKTQRTMESQNYLSGNLLCVQNDLSIESTKNKSSSNKLVEEVLIKEEVFKQSNSDITIQKKTQSLVRRYTKQSNLKQKYQSIFNIQSTQLALVTNSDPSCQKKKNNPSLSFTSQNDQQLNKQSQEKEDLENSIKQQCQNIFLTSNEGLQQQTNQIQECAIDKSNSQQVIQKQEESKIQKENTSEQQCIIRQIVVEKDISDNFNLTSGQDQKLDSQQLIEKDKKNENLKYYIDQIQECIIDQSNCQQEIKQQEESKNQKEKYYEKQSTIQQIVIESNASDKFNQQNVQFYKEDSQSLIEKEKISYEQSNEINENMEFEYTFTELMNQIQFNLKQNNYHLTQLMHFYEYEDIYLGFQYKDNIEKQTLIFKILYNPSQQNRVIYRQKTQIENKNLDHKVSKSINFRCENLCSYQDIDKLIQVIEWHEKVNLKCDRIISLSINQVVQL